MKLTYLLIFAASLLIVSGCAQKRPVLYQNAHYKQTSSEQREKDIDYCIKQGQENIGETSRGKKAVSGGVTGSIIGGAVGLGVGIITGNPGRSTAAGALGGGAGGAAGGALSDSGNALFRKYVDRCLREKGYDPIGWK